MTGPDNATADASATVHTLELGKSEREQTCANCRFLVRTGEWGGSCHRFPPTVSQATNLNGDTDWFNDHPGVANDEWCGEHQAAKKQDDGSE